MYCRTIIYATYPLRYSLCTTIYASASDSKSVGNIAGRHFWKPFQLFRRILNYVGSIFKAHSLQYWFSVEGTDRSWDAAVLSHCSLLRNPWTNQPVCWSIVVKEKQTIGSPFVGTFPYYRVSKATKDVHMHFFIHISNFCKLYQRIPGHFEANTRVFILISHLCLHLPDCVLLAGFPFLIVSAVFILFNLKKNRIAFTALYFAFSFYLGER